MALRGHSLGTGSLHPSLGPFPHGSKGHSDPSRRQAHARAMVASDALEQVAPQMQHTYPPLVLCLAPPGLQACGTRVSSRDGPRWVAGDLG